MALAYRSEIDGLRALAVIPVMLFHAGLPGLRGGYVGVDVFFVISGYLITSIILSERDAGTFSITGFYERRARRILPALFFVMACTIPFAIWWMPPVQFRDYAESLTATSLFGSNILFWDQSGYFAQAAEEKPLLHTWSLAIEEQFYLIFPLLLMLIMRFWAGRVRMILIGLALVSLGLCIAAVPGGQSAAFFLIHARAWELLAGALLALALPDMSGAGRWNGLAAGLGLAMICATIVLLDETTTYPGVFTILPVLGTVLVIAGAHPGTWVQRILSYGPVVSIGLISYSAYLWHQPLFAFARLRSLNAPSPVLMLALVFAALVLAYLTWRFIETPFRNRQRVGRRSIFAGSFAGIVVLVSAGLFGSLSDMAERRLSAEALKAVIPAHSRAEDCDWSRPLPEFPSIDVCEFGKTGTPAPLALWGDSHAGALLGALDDRLKQEGRSGLMLRNGHCRTIPGLYVRDKHPPRRISECEASQSALLDWLAARKPAAIAISLRWTMRVFPVEGASDHVGFDNGEGGREDEDYREYVAADETGKFVTAGPAKAAAIEKFLAGFVARGIPVAVIDPVPEVGWHVGNRNFKHLITEGAVPAEISTAASRYAQRNGFVLSALDALPPELNISRVKPSDLLCDTLQKGRCLAQINGVPMYFDEDHLSTVGAALVVDQLLPLIRFPQ